jgi:hypothetical protein
VKLVVGSGDPVLQASGVEPRPRESAGGIEHARPADGISHAGERDIDTLAEHGRRSGVCRENDHMRGYLAQVTTCARRALSAIKTAA